MAGIFHDRCVKVFGSAPAAKGQLLVFVNFPRVLFFLTALLIGDFSTE